MAASVEERTGYKWGTVEEQPDRGKEQRSDMGRRPDTAFQEQAHRERTKEPVVASGTESAVGHLLKNRSTLRNALNWTHFYR